MQGTTFEFGCISEYKLIKLINDIDVRKSSANPKLSARLLKDAFDGLSDGLCYLLNKSLMSGEFPESWRVGYVTSLPKTGNLLNTKNYRLISQFL